MSEQKFMGHGYYQAMEEMYSKRINELIAERDRYREAVQYSSMVAVDMDKALKQEYKVGWNAAREKARDLVRGLDHCDMNGHSCTLDIADRIWKMEPRE